MYYLMWRIMAGLHDEVTISFLLVGHTNLHLTGALVDEALFSANKDR